MRVSRSEFEELKNKVDDLCKETSKKTVNYWGREYPTVYGEILAIKQFLGIDTEVVPKKAASVVAVSKKKGKK